MADQEHHVPAGWYPDPLGLPQLRWWDNHAWTEHTSDARQPMTAQETIGTRLAYADDDETEEPAREPLRTDAGDAGTAPDSAFAGPDPVRSLEAPPWTGPRLPMSYDELLGVATDPEPPAPVAPHPSAAPVAEAGAVAETVMTPEAVGVKAVEEPEPTTAGSAPGADTAAVWAIALMPLIVLALALLLMLTGSATRDPGLFAAIVLGGSYLATVILAAIDRVLLSRMGRQRTANWDWALLGAPVYLLARMARTLRETGRGLRPFLTWTALSALLVGAAIAVPGLVIAFAPAVFAAEAERSVVEDARGLGIDLAVSCPDGPPLLVDASMTCTATADGASTSLEVRLVRLNGWIDWRVDDWGDLGR